jgi:hypothetical protein
MTDVPSKDRPGPDASDIVTGPIGSASLRDPATSGPEGAQLDQLPVTDSDDGRVAVPPAQPTDEIAG